MDNTELNEDQKLPERKKGRSALFWVIVGFGSFFLLGSILLVFIVGSFLFLSKTVVSDDNSFSKKPLQEIVVSGDGENKIALVSIKGVISDKPTDSILMRVPGIVEVVKKSLEQAAIDNSIKAVIFEVNSPGGGITASDMIYTNIKHFKEKTGKTVVVYMQDLAASGGYYVSIAADKIVAHPTTITGSIGVIMPLVNVAKLIEKYGIENQSIKSGLMKDMGSPLKKMLPEEENVLLNIIDEMYMRFVRLIAHERGMPIDQIKKLADGRIFTGEQAVGNGLIDAIGYFEDAVKITKDLAGLEKAAIIRYERKLSVGDFFKVIASRIFAKPEITLKFDELSFKNLSKPMYLWQGE